MDYDGIRYLCDSLQQSISEAMPETTSLRDQFAMSALNGLLSYSLVNPMSGNYHENCTCDNAAQAAYGYADAMLEARKVRDES